MPPLRRWDAHLDHVPILILDGISRLLIGGPLPAQDLIDERKAVLHGRAKDALTIVVKRDIVLHARIIMIVLDLEFSLSQFEQDAPVSLVLLRLKVFNKLVSSLLATRNIPFLDLIIGDQIAHEVLDDITLPFLQKHLLHEFEDAQVVDHVLDVFFASQLIPCLLELLVVEPLLAVVGPGT